MKLVKTFEEFINESSLYQDYENLPPVKFSDKEKEEIESIPNIKTMPGNVYQIDDRFTVHKTKKGFFIYDKTKDRLKSVELVDSMDAVKNKVKK